MAERTLLDVKLRELAESTNSAKALSDEVSGSSEETAHVFSTHYEPAYLKNSVGLGGDEPNGVSIRFATH